MADELYKRWAALVDAETAGRGLTEAEQAFCRQVCERSPAAAAEQALVTQLEQPGDAPPDADARAIVAQAIEKVEADAQLESFDAEMETLAAQARGGRGAFRIAVASVVTVALAAGVAVVALRSPEGAMRGDAPRPASRATPAPAFRAELVYASGEVRVEGTASARHGSALQSGLLRPEQVVATGDSGRACLAIEPGIDVCAGPKSRLRIRTPEASERGVELLAGSAVASLEAQPAGSRFSITAGRVAATAVGTVFSVAREPADGDVVTTVSEGVVGVEAPRGQRMLRAHERIRARGDDGSLTLEPVTRLEEARLHATVRVSDLWREGLSATLEVSGPEGGEVWVDGVSVGRLPLLTMIPAGEHGVALAGGKPQLIRLEPGEHRRLTLAETDSVDVRPAPVGGAAAVGKQRATGQRPVAKKATTRRVPGVGADVDALLHGARRHALSHRFHAAARSYQRLRAAHPRAPEAHGVLVALGELQLTRLGEPATALQAFERYLERGGPLAQEAAHGRIRALAALNRGDAERRAIERFLRRYPNSPHRRALARRAEHLPAQTRPLP